jgi:intermediate cleaving peptidase 55
MKFARPGLNESAIASHFEYHTTQGGASRLAYVPVCASGTSALIIHYTSNDRLLRKGDTLLLDAGCEYAGYASDITRTFPVDGTFSDPQKDLYAAVLSTNKRIIKLCTESQGFNMNELHHRSCKVLLEELKQIGFKLDMHILERDLFPHFISHPLGMDLHDTPSFERTAACVLSKSSKDFG